MKIRFSAFVVLLFLSSLFAQSNNLTMVDAIVYADSTAQGIKVKNLKMDFKFAGYGVYIPANYPVVTEIPLENGEVINFENVAEARFKGERVNWKKYIEKDERHNYRNLDKEGYYHWSAIEVNTKIRDWDGNTTQSRIKRPDNSDIYLIGSTPRGDFELQIDQENDKTVIVEFEPNFIMQCTQNPSHVYPNVNWKYCPKCGGDLKRIKKP
jgi:hypothetical protein